MTIPQGTHVGGFLHELLGSLATIRQCEFLEIRTPPSVEFRPGASPELKELVQQVREVVSDGDSFTETLMKVGAEAGAADAVLEVAQFHQPLAAAIRTHVVHPSVVDDRLIQSLSGALELRSMLVLTSRVTTDLGTRHIPMADFKLNATVKHHASAIAAAKRLGPGHLLTSGSSYHYYGRELLTDSELTRWLLHAQLLSRYVDTRWVTHQLLEGRCALRVSQGGGQDAEPVVLTEV